MSPNRKFCIFLNGRSGDQGEDERRARLTALCDAAGVSATIVTPNGKQRLEDAAREAIRRSQADVIVAAGGDGTIAAVATAAHDAEIPMGVIPQGTFNYFARGLGIPEDAEAAIEVLAGGQLEQVALAEANGAVFLNNTSLGIYPLILQKRESIYARWGRSRIAAYWSVLLTLSGMRRPLRMTITVDGRDIHLRTPLIFVANSVFQLDRFNLDGVAALKRGEFALFTARNGSTLDLARTAFRLAGGAAQKGEDFDLVTGRDITLQTGRKRALVARDGEKSLMHTPIRIKMRERPLQVIVPTPDASTDTTTERDIAASS
ncbi:diacylglycerol kinase family protein [Salipiger sp. 1_MG-2023]|uniref:diacylglycerol/lipid kinase family protein n=1 Tax=Salipiger sp. 1_MG-2023 TaxID=3062665 RepID=UPI0026E2D8EA|nr:diacylglycerol kinase family protein [Salipiger sp. 1_MG-2023]MDO6585666.1 diacylglycerol kinase family protein [Salipiger sp. 1_MG-2023]